MTTPLHRCHAAQTDRLSLCIMYNLLDLPRACVPCLLACELPQFCDDRHKRRVISHV